MLNYNQCGDAEYARQQGQSLIRYFFAHVWLLGLASCCFVTAAQLTNTPPPAPEWVVRSWQSEDGLPQNTVNAVLQTRDGFLWVGTSGGLARFDGAKFRTFGLQDGLRSVQIVQLAEDQEGSLWIGTAGGGLSRWEKERFTSYGPNEGFPEGIIQAMAPDRDGSLWIGTEKGLVKWSRGAFTNIGPAEGLPRISVRALTQDTNGAIWVATLGKGLFRGTNGQFTSIEKSGPREVYSLLAHRDGSIWAGFGNGWIWRWRDGKWDSFNTSNQLPVRSFESLAQSPDGSVWFTAQDSGLYRFDGKTFSRAAESAEFGNAKARSIALDDEGSIWVGTSPDGLFRFSPRVLQYWRTPSGASVAEDAKGLLWAGINSDIGQFQGSRFNRLTNSPNLIYCSTTTSDGSVWMAGEQALFRMEPGRPLTNVPVQGEAIRALCADGEKLWLGTYYSALLKWETNALRVIAINGSFGSGITCLARESEETLWVGSLSGLYQWSRGVVRKWNTQEALLSPNIRALHRDPDGTLWIGTLGGGLGRLKDGRITSVTTRHGLIDDVISQIIADDIGNLWLGCNRGIMRLNRKELNAVLDGKSSELQPLVLGKNEGMRREQCVSGVSPTVVKTRDGRLLFPTRGGIAEINPARLVHFPVYKERAEIDGVTLDGQPKSLKGVDIPPGKHRLEIVYTASSLRGGEALRFRYRLDGLDRDWVKAGTRRSAAYEALEKGRYNFRVQVQNCDSTWSEPPASFIFTVQPFLWQTGWFRIGCALLLAALGAGAAAAITASRRRRERREFTRAQKQSAALLSLSVHPSIIAGDLPAAFREICEQAARTLDVQRVGVWLLEDNNAALRAANQFDSIADEHTSGMTLPLAGAPRYIDALEHERVVVVRNARHDPRTIELGEADSGMARADSVLDGPVRISGKLAAVIRHEHLGPPRDWRHDEISFASEMADQVARTLLNAERESANRQLRESEERFRTIADASRVMIWMCGPDNLGTYFSKGWLEFTGRTSEQEHGLGWSEGVHPDDLARCIQTCQESFDARREFTMEFRLRCHDGEYRWLMDHGLPRFAPDGTFLGYIGTCAEITALKEAQEHLRAIVEGAPNAMIVTDAQGKITMINARTEQIFGFTRGELTGQPVERVLPEMNRVGYSGHFEHNTAHPTTRYLLSVAREHFGRRKDGALVPLEIGLNQIDTPEGQFVLASIIDITERIQNESRLRESDERMTLAADAANLGMWVWEAPETYLWTSPKWKAIHGYGPNEDIRYDALIERVHPEDRAAVGRAIATAFDHGDFHVQHRVMLPDKTVRWISSSGRVEQLPGGGVMRLLGVSIDITERKETEEAAREVSGKLITAQEDERRRIARDLHDDLNQRLALLSVEADLLGRMDNQPQAQSLIADIAARVQDLSSEVHKLSYQLHPAKLDQLGLVAATRSFCVELSKQCGLPIGFTHKDVPRVLNDEAALSLYRIVQESMQNIVKHSGATRAEVELKRNDGHISLVISDNGHGFEMATLGARAGLGLVSMRERVRLVHGDIAFHSAPGQGLRVEVTVPLLFAEEAAS